MHTRQRSRRRTGVRRTHYFYLTLLLALIVGVTLLAHVAVWAADSDLDPTFDGDGIVITSINDFDFANDFAIQPDGKIVVVGVTISDPLHDFALTRYNPDGSLDGTFGSGGIVATSFGVDVFGRAVAIQSDGKIVVTGIVELGCCPRIGVVRYNTDGSLDSSFGSGGIVSTSVGDDAIAEDLVVQSDGKIVVVGFSSSSVSASLIVVRYNSDGSLDDTFAGDGVFLQQNARGAAVALQSDGKIVAAGLGNANSDFLVERLNTDGSPDTSFGTGGIVTTDMNGDNDAAEGVAIQPDGKIVAVGWTTKQAKFGGALARYNTDGSLDTSFDSDGIVNLLPTATGDEFFNGVALQTDGKIVVAGSFNPGTGIAVEVKRYTVNGSPDGTFGSAGSVITPVGTRSSAAAVAIQADGKIVAAGAGNVSFDSGTGTLFEDFFVIRYGAANAVNNPPVVTITGPAGGSIYAVNTPINFTGTFTDDAGDTHTAQWTFNSVSQPATVVEPSGSTPGEADTTYTFNEAGVYKVTLTVTDNGNFSGTADTVNGLEAIVVIYDPSAGFVSGGGWINSPPGAFVPMPELTGRISFGFVSRYLKGAMVPTGNTEFQFKAGNLNFSSTSYEWLVISGGRKAQYKGFGTINNIGNYNFLLTAIDGDQPGGDGQDKFRMQIWTDANDLIYDNQLNAPYSDDPTGVLGGGSIVIHH